MIIVEKQHGEESKGDSNEDPFDWQIPERNQPASRLC